MKHVTLALALLVAAPATAQVASYTPIPGTWSCDDVTPDGQIVVGGGSGGAYYWRWQVDPQPTYIGGVWAVAISDDGSVIAGNIEDPASGFYVPARWTEATGWVPLTGFGVGCPGVGTASDMTSDGSVIVGLGWNGCESYGFRWTEATGAVYTQLLGNGTNRANAVARNGATIGGFAQGSFFRTPAVWFPDGSGVLIDIDSDGQIDGVNADGSLVVGESNGEAFMQAIPGPLTVLGKLNAAPEWIGRAVDVDDAGRRVLGQDIFQLAKHTWVWTEGTGVESLSGKLAALGVAGVPTLNDANRMNADGTVMVGDNDFGTGWIVTLPPPAEDQVYGCGTNPAGSLEVLSGSSAIGETIVLGLDNPLGTQTPGQTVALLSLAGAPAPGFPCGVPLPGWGMSSPGAAGEVLIAFVPPNPFFTFLGPLWTGTPVPMPVPLAFDTTLLGLTFYAQGVLWDFGGTSGVPFGLTDAVALTIGT